MKISREGWKLVGVLLFIPLALCAMVGSMGVGYLFSPTTHINLTAFFVALFILAGAVSFVMGGVMTRGDKEYAEQLKRYRQEKLEQHALDFWDKFKDCKTEDEVIARLQELGVRENH